MLRKFELRALGAHLRAYVPFLIPFMWSALAHAQAGGGGTIDFGNLENFMQSVVTAAHIVGATFILVGLFFAAFFFLGRNIIGGVVSTFAALLGAGIFGWGASWVSSMTGVAVAP